MSLRNTDGQYIPSFFSIILETDDDVEVAVKKNPATFTHEFVHYLQDLILPYNIRVNLSKIRWFKNISQVALNKGYLKRPFKEWDSDSDLLKLQYLYTIGSGKFVDLVTNIGKPNISEEKRCAFDESFTHRQRKFGIYKYNIPIDSQGAISTNYDLGARDLLEYIAHKIENKHFPTAIPVSQFPYESVDVLFEKYGLSDVPTAIRVCIAEYCLYNDNPIRLMFNQFLENNTIRALILDERTDFQKIYNFLMHSGFSTTDGITESLLDKTSRRLEDFKNDLQFSYLNSPQIVQWVSRVNIYAKNRLSNTFIFSDMYRMNTSDLQNFIGETITTIGIPLVMNKKGKWISLPNTQAPQKGDAQQFIQFYILERFLFFLDGKTKSCPIRKFCHCNYTVDCNGGHIFDRKNRVKENVACPFWKFLDIYKLSNIQYR